MLSNGYVGHYKVYYQTWLPIKSTIYRLRNWEQLNNSDFNSLEFDGIKK